MHVQIAPGRCGEKQHASPRMPRCPEKDEYIPYNYDLTNADFKGHEVSRVISESRELILFLPSTSKSDVEAASRPPQHGGC